MDGNMFSPLKGVLNALFLLAIAGALAILVGIGWGLYELAAWMFE